MMVIHTTLLDESMTYEVKQWVQVRENVYFIYLFLFFCTINFKSSIILYCMDLWRFIF